MLFHRFKYAVWLSLTISVTGAAQTISLIPAGGLGNEVWVSPGDTVTIEIYIADTAPTATRGFQVTLPFAATGGDSGTVFHDGNEPSADQSREDYLFRNVDVQDVYVAARVGPPPALVTASLHDGVVVTDGLYAGEFTYVVSEDAAGDFRLEFVVEEPGGTTLLDGQSPAQKIELDAVFGALIHVGPPGPFIARAAYHPARPAPVGSPLSGYIDSRSNTDDVGLREVDLVFTREVRNRGGLELTGAAFSATETGGGEEMVVTLDPVQTFVHAETGTHAVRLVLSRPPSPQEWLTIKADVEDMDGTAIPNLGDLGPGAVEPDRVDIGSLPCDVDQSGHVSPLDFVRMRQFSSGRCNVCDAFACQPELNPEVPLCFDYNRDGLASDADFESFREAYFGTGADSTPAWRGARMNNPQP